MELLLLHRTSKDPLDLGSIPVWRTCLRQIALFSAHQYRPCPRPTDEIFREEEAVAFLIEILCGLHSPNLGETEVFGQFKTFLSQAPKNHVLLARPALLKMILHTVKEVRHRHLKDCGSLSYGQLMRRSLKAFSKVNVWGFGQLGQEVGRCLDDKDLNFVVRDPQRAMSRNEWTIAPNFFAPAQKPFAPAHVIAAPFSDEEIARLAEQEGVEVIYDLRGESSLQAPKLIALPDVLAEAKRLKQEQALVIPACKEKIFEKCSRHFLAAQHRPFGWEDLCG